MISKLDESYRKVWGIPLTWTCHICGKERPDDKISVFKKSLKLGGEIMGQQNIRYCNDKEECIEKAKAYDFAKDR